MATSNGYSYAPGDHAVKGFTASTDLSAKQYHFVKRSAATTVTFNADATTAPSIGVLQNEPESGDVCVITGPGMRSRLKLGGTVQVGASLTADSDGAGVATTTRRRVHRSHRASRGRRRRHH